MVYYHSSISVCHSADGTPTMEDSGNSPDSGVKSRNKKLPNSPNCLKSPNCNRSQFVAIDVVILIAVVFASGFLLFPYIKFLTLESIDIAEAIIYIIGDEISDDPLIYGSIGLSVLCSGLAGFIFLIFRSSKCGKRNCRGLRKAAEFDIQLETEDCLKSSNQFKNGVEKQIFEFPKELETELKKIAPPNGKAVLIFRGRCGCSIGRLEVAGSKKLKKMKK